MTIYSPRERAAQSTLPLAAEKVFEVLEDEAKEARADLAQTGERYRLARGESLAKAYASRLSSLRGVRLPEVVEQKDADAHGNAIRSNGGDLKTDYHERMIAAKKEGFAREMEERQRQRQTLQRLRQEELDLLLKNQGYLQAEVDGTRYPADDPTVTPPRPGFLRRLVAGRLFSEGV